MLNTLQFRGATCYYREESKGKNIMLVHGFVEEGSMWDELVKSLKKTHRVIVPDLPGFGKSGLPADGSKLSIDLYAEFIATLATKAKLKKFVLLGHSMGGYAALYFAEKHPDQLRGFGLVNSHCYADTPEKKEGRKKSIAHIKQYGTKVFVNELYHTLFHPAFLKKNKTLVNGLIKKAQGYSPEALMQATAAMMNRENKEEVLKQLNIPVLFIQGKDDLAAPIANTLKQASLPSIADIHIFSNARHMSVFERKAETIAIVKDYLGRLK